MNSSSSSSSSIGDVLFLGLSIMTCSPRTTFNLVRMRAPTPTDRVRQRRAEDRYGELAVFDAHTHPAGMIVVTEAEAAAIRAAFEQRGELSAAVELRRLFPAVTDTAQARACARTIAGWKPLAVPLRSGKRRDPGRDR